MRHILCWQIGFFPTGSASLNEGVKFRKMDTYVLFDAEQLASLEQGGGASAAGAAGAEGR
jgi:hypothetical protein